MGCGASVFGPRNSQASNDLGRQPLLEAAPSAANTRGLVTPQRNTRQTNSHSLQLSGAPTHKKAAKGLRIDTAVASRESSGMAVTPMGKVRHTAIFIGTHLYSLSHHPFPRSSQQAADEFKYYCPLCMMFYRSILELPCCKQSTCAFCFGEYLTQQLEKLKDKDGAEATALAMAANAAPAAAAGGKSARQAMANGLALPAGCACPQCATVAKGPKKLIVVEGLQEQHVKYLDSPQTVAEIKKVGDLYGGAGASSPLKVGDDHNAMARKMLPFGSMGVLEERTHDTKTNVEWAPSEAAAAGAGVVDPAGGGALAAEEEALMARTPAPAAVQEADGEDAATEVMSSVSASPEPNDVAAGPETVEVPAGAVVAASA